MRLVVLLALLAATVAGVAAGWTELVPVLAAAVVLTGIGLNGLAGARVRLAVDVRPARCGRGDQAEILVSVTNTGRRATMPATVGWGASVAAVPRIPAGDTWHGRLAVDTDRRGVVAVGPVLVRRDDPLGISGRRWAVDGTVHTLIVQPVVRPVELHLDGARAPRGRRAGRSLAAGGTFRGLRDYRPGDHPRTVDWKATARTGRLIVRQLDGDGTAAVTVALDVRAGAYPAGPDVEAAVDLAASVVCAAIDAGVGFRLVAGDRLLAHGPSHRAHRVRALDALAAVTTADTPDWTVPSPDDGTLVLVTGPAPLSLPAARRYAQTVVLRGERSR